MFTKHTPILLKGGIIVYYNKYRWLYLNCKNTKNKRRFNMAKKKYIAVFAGSLLLFNGVFISLNVPSISSNSTVIAAEEEPPADEEIPDAEQLEYQKKLKTLLDEADEYIKDNDHENFDSFFEEEAGTLRNLVTAIKDEYKVQKKVANTRTKVKEEVTKQPVNKVVLVGTKPVVTEVEKEFTETQSIPFETVKENDATLEKGVEKEKTAGETGEKTITYKAKFKDDKEVANTRTKVKEEVTKQPVNKVVLVGTKEKTIVPGGTGVIPSPTPDVKPKPREKFSVTPEDGIQNLVVEEKPTLSVTTEEIPFSVEIRYNSKLGKGVRKEITPGENGKRRVFSKVEIINGKEKTTVISIEIEKEVKNKIIEIGTLEPKTNIARNKENLKVKNINKNEKVESVKGKLPSTGISQINTFIAGLFALIIAGVLTIFKRKKR